MALPGRKGISRESYIFPPIKFKSLDYMLDLTTNFKVAMNILTLPMPYNSETNDHYIHTGNIPDITYRTPWIRGRLISTCRLFVNGSALEDLGEKRPSVDTLERFSVRASQEVIPSSNPNSQEHDMEEVLRSLHGPRGALPCQESFDKASVKERSLGNSDRNTELLLPEEVVCVDPLTRFLKHLPLLNVRLSRLRVLPVPVSFLSSTGGVLSEEAKFSHCASSETPPPETCVFIKEEFVKEPLMVEESLMLAVELESFTLSAEHLTGIPSVRTLLNVAPEWMEKQLPPLDELHKATKTTALARAVSQYDVHVGFVTESKIHADLLESLSARPVLLPTDLELELPLTPTSEAGLTPLCLHTCHLGVEQLPPVHTHDIVSAGEREKMELALWTAEKHPTAVVAFLLAEPQACEMVVAFCPLAEAMKALQLIGRRDDLSVPYTDEHQAPEGVPSMPTWSSLGFTESMSVSSECPCAAECTAEDFTTFPPGRVENVLRACEEDDTQTTGEVPVRSILKNPIIQTHQPPHEADAPSVSHSPTPAPIAVVHKAKSFSLCTTASSLAVLSESASSHTGRQARGNDGRAPPATPSERGQRRPPANPQSPRRDGGDPLLAFIMLRSQQRSLNLDPDPGPGPCPEGPATRGQTTQAAPQLTPECNTELDGRPSTCMSGVVTGNATRTQELSEPPVSHSKQSSTVVHVQATGGQWHAYCELLAFAQPCLNQARDLGLSVPALGDFSTLAPDQTRFLLKQQEKELCRTQGPDKELLFNQVALIHVLATVKDVLLKCDLPTAVDYLAKAADTCSGHRLEQLVRRLQIVQHLSLGDQGPCSPKMLELQTQLVAWLQGRRGGASDRVVVIIAVDSDGLRAMLIRGLGDVAGEAVASAYPEEGKAKLNGARLINSVQASVCVLVCGQHIGADFPWSCFSLAVEWDHTGISPWASVCRERGLQHLCFSTGLPTTREAQTLPWSLEEAVPYVLLVTEGVLHIPLLLQTLESSCNVTVLERSCSAAMATLGRTQSCAVVTVDESTAVLIQGQKGLGHHRACEGVALRLTALSLQYSSCWLLLHGPDHLGGGLSTEAFGNLVLIYSSLVLFGMKSEDLNVKVLIASDVLDVALWIRHICFHSLMASSSKPASYLDRGWLAVVPSQEEKCLLTFPCVNPLVSQLMLRRAPSLHWLLGASLPQLGSLLPEVPHKVLKLFTETTSLYKTTAGQFPMAETHTAFIQVPPPDASPPVDPWAPSRGQHLLASPLPSFLSRPAMEESGRGGFFATGPAEDEGACGGPGPANFQLRLPSPRAPAGGSDAPPHDIWTRRDHGPDPWAEQEEQEEQDVWRGGAAEEAGLRGWSSRGMAAGRVVGRRAAEEEWGLQLHPRNGNDGVVDGPFAPGPACPAGSQGFSSHLRLPWSSSSGGQGGAEGGGEEKGGGGAIIPPHYGSNLWAGRERKRSAAEAGVATTVRPLSKRGRLSYEKVPGRIDGQTRLRFF